MRQCRGTAAQYDLPGDYQAGAQEATQRGAGMEGLEKGHRMVLDPPLPRPTKATQPKPHIYITNGQRNANLGKIRFWGSQENKEQVSDVF